MNTMNILQPMRLIRLFARSLAAGMLAAVIVVAGAGIARADDQSLFQRLGGMEGVTTIVHDLLQISLQDERIKHTFENTAIPRLEKLIVAQICDLTGGPCEYKGKDMHKSHKPLKITTAQFNALVEDLQIAMDRNEVPFHTQSELLALLAPMKRDIVTR